MTFEGRRWMVEGFSYVRTGSRFGEFLFSDGCNDEKNAPLNLRPDVSRLRVTVMA